MTVTEHILGILSLVVLLLVHWRISWKSKNLPNPYTEFRKAATRDFNLKDEDRNK